MAALKHSIAIFLLALTIMPVRGQLIVADSFDVSNGNSPGSGFAPDGPTAGVNYQVSSRLSGTVSGPLWYYQTSTARAASSYSIRSNKVWITASSGAGRFTFTSDGFNPLDFGSILGVANASASDPVTYELSVKMANQSGGTERTSFGVATADNGVQAWALGFQLVNAGTDLTLYRRVDAGCNPSGADYNDVIATLPGQAGAEVTLKVRITDAGGESGVGNFNSSYQVFANEVPVFASAIGNFRFADSAVRVILFDTAPGAGPVSYDAFSLNLVTVTTPPPTTNLPLSIFSRRLTPAGFEIGWWSEIGADYSLLKCTNLSSPTWALSRYVTAASTNTVVTDTAPPVASYYCVAQLAQIGISLSNVSVSQRPGSPWVDIYYDLQDQYAGRASISVLVSTDGGQTYNAAAATFTGDVGLGMEAGQGRHIAWNVGADWSLLAAANLRIKIIADRAPAGADMALIPAGSFNMGNTKTDGLACESPVHAVSLSAFYLERYEVTKRLWDEVAQWGTNHGYSFESPSVAGALNHPVQQVSWYDAVKWCNARSEKEGLPPAYFVDRTWAAVYRTGEVDLAEANVRWYGAGYRLPSEAEWEKAARGGLDGKRFPFGDTLTQAQANYWSTSFEAFDVNGVAGPHPLALQFPNALPVGSFRPSGYGLYDMAGNSWEWCWDYYGDSWYSDARASSNNSHGPATASWGGDRVYRGGSGVDIAWKSRVANRADAPPRFAMGHFGFRVALPAGNRLAEVESPIFNITPP